MDYALDRGVNFWDAAEMYPVPPQAETYGRTEEIIGNWFAAREQARQGDPGDKGCRAGQAPRTMCAAAIRASISII